MARAAFKMSLRGMNKVERMIRDFPVRASEIFEEKLESGARTLGVELARQTRPFGASPHGAAVFQETISLEIGMVFTAGRVWEDLKRSEGIERSRQWWAIFKAGDLKAGKAFLDQFGGDFSGIKWQASVPHGEHKAARTGPRGQVGKTARQKTLVTNQSKLRNYIKKKQRTVGAAKAGWMAAAKAASASGRVGKGMPAWANTGRHKKSTGSVVYTGGKGQRVARVQNHVPWASVALPKYGEKRALDSARGRLRKALYMALAAEERKLNQRLARV